MIVDKPYNGSTFYGRAAKHIYSTSELPKRVRVNLNRYLTSILGTMADSLAFSHGQVVNLKKKFKEDSAYRYEWIVPKYDLNFVLKDLSIEVKKYYLQVGLDEYGQVVGCNWPRKGFSDKNAFKSRKAIQDFALWHAVYKGFDTTGYEVNFKMLHNLDVLCWVFKFPVKSTQGVEYYNSLEIPWNRIEVVDSYYDY